MRILHSIHSVNPEGGGPIEFVRQIMPLHSERGGDSAVVSLDDPAQTFVKEFPGRLYALGPSLLNYGFSWRYHGWLKRELGQFDVVIVHGLWQQPSTGTRFALRGTNKPYVIFPHGMLDPWFNQAFPAKHLKKAIYWSLFESQTWQDAKAVLFTSEEERLRARCSFQPYRCQEVVLGFGTAAPIGDTARMKEVFLSLYPTLRDKRFLLFLGRIHAKKGLDLLLEGFANMNGRAENLHLVLAGPDSGDYGERLRNSYPLVADRVTWTGMLSGDFKWGALEACQALILPSHQENFGVVVAEALSLGKPVLISDKVNIWPAIVEEEAGLVETDTVEGTQRLLERWLSLPDEQCLRMQDSARRCFQTHFEIHSLYERLMTILEQIVSEGKKERG